MADVLAQVKADVAAQKTQIDANNALLVSIKAQLDALASQTTVDPADVAALSAQIEANTQEIAASDAANTPAPPAS